MKVQIDRVGRVVIPKPLRDLLGIAPDSELEISRDGTGLRLDPVTGHGREVVDVDGLPLLRSVPGHVLTDSDVARLRDSDRR
ncbi:MAG: AbrB/MazE/SpoVT family DNA-binding domain-containing protein [Actinomycetota bacterium]|nr:AbrB/MazE/SpoVT family DNA-binding domain-containing protein [Actinomycetota bacterium]